MDISHPRWEPQAGVAFFEALGKLDRRCQFIIESHLINGIPAEDIAKSLKLQPQSIPALLSRCREMLRHIYKNKTFVCFQRPTILS